MKYNIGDMFIDYNFNDELRSYLYKIDEQYGIKYYWLTCINHAEYQDTYWTEDELEEILQENVEHIPVGK
jgi:hypothetical protein